MISLVTLRSLRPADPQGPDVVIDGADDVQEIEPRKYRCFKAGEHVGDIFAHVPPQRFENGQWGWKDAQVRSACEV